MQRKVFVILTLVLALVALTAALASADAHLAAVSIGHGINGIDLGTDEALPVDIIVDGACAVQDLEFGEFVGPNMMPAGTYSVTVALSDGNSETCTGAAAIGPAELTFEAGDNVTVFAHLTDAGAPIATLFDNDVSDVVAGHTRLTVRHTAWAPTVDLEMYRGWVRGRLVAEFEDLSNPNQIGPADVRPGAYAVVIYPADSDVPVFQVPATPQDDPFVTHPHRSQIVYAVGSLTNGTFGLMIQTFDLGHVPPPRAVPPQ